MGEPCEGLNTTLVVDTKSHKMWLCQENKSVGEYGVALGLGGVEKRKHGDKKTPLGEYNIGTPRPSVRFGIFIPVGYPTQEQVSNGYSGSAIGVHGPTRVFKMLGGTVDCSNWTNGCIAVATDVAISEISHWIKEQKVSRIIIR
jgi:murein L,D-transpeptidase YafK